MVDKSPGGKPSKKPQRVSMKGMGADAFFGLPAEVEEEPSTQTDLPVKQLPSETASHSPVLPVDQPDSIPASQEDGTPVNQSTDIPVDQQASVPEKQLMKATYYIWPEQDMKLETIRLARR